jgi:hypothetical protein
MLFLLKSYKNKKNDVGKLKKGRNYKLAQKKETSSDVSQKTIPQTKTPNMKKT